MDTDEEQQPSPGEGILQAPAHQARVQRDVLHLLRREEKNSDVFLGRNFSFVCFKMGWLRFQLWESKNKASLGCKGKGQVLEPKVSKVDVVLIAILSSCAHSLSNKWLNDQHAAALRDPAQNNISFKLD